MPVTSYPTAPALAGFTFRHVVMPDDFRAMNDVANAVRQAEGDEWFTSYEQFRAYYENLSNCDPATDIVVAERYGRVVGYGRTEWTEEIDGKRIYYPMAFAPPAAGRPLLEAITDAMEARCRQIASVIASSSGRPAAGGAKAIG